MKSVSIKLILVTLMYFLSSSAAAEEWMRTRMFFGLSIPDGGGVSLQQWEKFTVDVIAPAFKQGFNVVDSIKKPTSIARNKASVGCVPRTFLIVSQRMGVSRKPITNQKKP